MNPIGMHYGFWSHNWDEIAYIPLMEKLAWLGFDICEVASAEWGYYDDARLRELKACADHNGLGITYSIGLEAKYDLASDDPAVRENGIRHVTRILESMPRWGRPSSTACPTPGGRPCPTTESPWTRSAARRSLPWSPCPGS